MPVFVRHRSDWIGVLSENGDGPLPANISLTTWTPASGWPVSASLRDSLNWLRGFDSVLKLRAIVDH